ncbi:MAG: hypothetical protein ACETWQ_22505 [Phycisphaerae bacterium]
MEIVNGQPAVLRFEAKPDQQSYDFTQTDFTKDYNYHDLDLSTKIPVGTVSVTLWCAIKSSAEIGEVSFAASGYTGEYLKSLNFVQVAGVGKGFCIDIPVKTDRKIRYRISNIVWVYINVNIVAWLVK